MRLINHPFIGRKFTWSRGKSQNKLDHYLVDVEWTPKFPEMKLWSLRKSISDHYLLLLETVKDDWGPKPFRSIDTWFSHLVFIKKVREEWSHLGEI